MVLIDQVDALSLSLARDPDALEVALELVARLRLIPGVRVLLSCRTFDRNSDPLLRRMQSGRDFPLLPLSDGEINGALAAMDLSVEHLTRATHDLLHSPLHLDLFLRVLQGNRRFAAHGLSAGFDYATGALQGRLESHRMPARTAGTAGRERRQVVRLLTRFMDSRQKTTAPVSLFEGDNAHLLPAVRWLATEGILIGSGDVWSFLHQTFFDFCYARGFVARMNESGASLCETIVQSEQGTFSRPQMRQVLTYLRDSDPNLYIQELQKLLNAPGLRFHLRDLLLRWLGQQQNPTDDEWLVVQRLLLDPQTRPELLRAFAYQHAWFERITGTTA